MNKAVDTTYARGPIANTTAEKQGSIRREQHLLEESIAALGATADCIVARLGTALRPPGPQAVQSGVSPERPSAECDLADDLVAKRESIGRIHRMLSDALDRLEL